MTIAGKFWFSYILVLIIGFWCLNAHASNCNPNDQSGCPAACPATLGSLTAATITGSGWTQGSTTITGVDCLNHVEYHHSVCPYSAPSGGNESDCTYDVYYPHGANLATLFPIFCIHGGGGYFGEAPGCWGYFAGTTTADVIKIQQRLDTQNPVGGKGIAIYDINYPLTAGGNTWNGNIFPVQWQQIKCFEWHVIGSMGSTLPGSPNMIGVYGPSWGAQMAWWLSNTPDNLYSANCGDSPPATDPKFRTVGAWMPFQWMLPANNSGWDNAVDTSHFHQAITGQLASTVEATLQATSTSLNAEPWQQVTQTNYATLANSQNMFQFGATDPLIVWTWGSGATYGGHGVYTINKYAALSPPLHPYVEVIPNCVHECDIGQLNAPSQIDAMNFLLGTNQTTSGGTGSSSGVTGAGR